MEEGYKFLCTDLDYPPCYDATKRLFPGFRFQPLDILSNCSNEQYDACVAISLIYLFDTEQLNKFFCNINKSLNIGGHLIVCGAGAPDNIWSRFWLSGYLLFECYLIAVLGMLRHQASRRVHKQHFGYRYREKELMQLASKAGFSMVARQYYPSIADFSRSLIWQKFIAPLPGSLWVCKKLSMLAPYLRIYDFQKIRDLS